MSVINTDGSRIPTAEEWRDFVYDMELCLNQSQRNWVTNHPWPMPSDTADEARFKARWRTLRGLPEEAPQPQV